MVNNKGNKVWLEEYEVMGFQGIPENCINIKDPSRYRVLETTFPLGWVTAAADIVTLGPLTRRQHWSRRLVKDSPAQWRRKQAEIRKMAMSMAWQDGMTPSRHLLALVWPHKPLTHTTTTGMTGYGHSRPPPPPWSPVTAQFSRREAGRLSPTGVHAWTGVVGCLRVVDMFVYLMDEDVLVSVVRGDESIALDDIEPLASSGPAAAGWSPCNTHPHDGSVTTTPCYSNIH